jgi:hypothetical protein
MSKMLEIHWQNRDAIGSVDLLPIALFAQDRTDESIHHRLRLRDRDLTVNCKIDVNGNIAELTYDQAEARRYQIWAGTTQILFANDKEKTPNVRWAEPGGAFEDLEPRPKCKFVEEGVDQEVSRLDRLGKISSRPAQRIFSSQLREAYDGKCAVTGCATPEVLEAAHIRTYSDGNPFAISRK